MKNFKKNIKVIIGLVISAVFMYMAFSKVDYSRLWEALKEANYWYLIPGIGVMFLSYWLRSYRWKFLMIPITDKPVKTALLFKALLIGYMGNSFLPAHLGEFIRAYIVGKKEKMPASTVFGTIVTERIIDVLSLIFLMAVTMIIYPFPDWVRNSGYVVLGCALVLSVVLVFMKIYKQWFLDLISKLTRILPQSIREKLVHTLDELLDGIVPLKKGVHYLVVFILTLAIWMCYVGAFQVMFYCFDFVSQYNLPWTAALVLLVITTISVLVPSSPGYVGTYHYLCKLSLGLFAVPEAKALSYAFIIHGINFFPLIIIGLILLPFMNISLKTFYKEREEQEREQTTVIAD